MRSLRLSFRPILPCRTPKSKVALALRSEGTLSVLLRIGFFSYPACPLLGFFRQLDGLSLFQVASPQSMPLFSSEGKSTKSLVCDQHYFPLLLPLILSSPPFQQKITFPSPSSCRKRPFGGLLIVEFSVNATLSSLLYGEGPSFSFFCSAVRRASPRVIFRRERLLTSSRSSSMIGQALEEVVFRRVFM